MIKIRTEIKRNWLGGHTVTAQVQGLTDDRLGKLARGIAARARENAAKKPFKERTGELEQKIEAEKIGPSHYKIETYSGHASFIEWGTKYISKKMAFLWPAYRRLKRRFMRSRKWV